MKVVDVIQHGKYGVLDEGGSTLEFLALPNEAMPDYCVMIGTIPAGGCVPLHNHGDIESFFLLSGEL